MTIRQRGLGRGLSALIPSVPPAALEPQQRSTSGMLVVPPEQILPNPMQPRRDFPPAELDALAASIRAHGILQPLVVSRRTDGRYELIAGERRLRASRRAGLVTVPIVIRDGVVDDRTKLELAIVENVQREHLNAIDRALAYEQLAEEFGLTHEQIAERVGVARPSITHVLRLLALPEDMRQAVRDGRVSEGHAKVLLGIADPAEQRAWFLRILEGGLSVAQAARETPRKRLAPRSPRAATGTASDPNLRAKALALQQRLGAKVRIEANASGGGTIAITYTDREELDGIVQTITA
ncbi:MAG: ParB/RepB/Spo0J family partition protein [bacterium]|nr:ParB/RepB/Spo0J family partition protein [bacterium]